jgi:hypothetical protein
VARSTGTAASNLTRANGDTSNVVVLGILFFEQPQSIQDRVLLVHEALHVALNLNDVGLANALHLTNDGTLDGASKTISTFLALDCPPSMQKQ